MPSLGVCVIPPPIHYHAKFSACPNTSPLAPTTRAQGIGGGMYTWITEHPVLIWEPKVRSIQNTGAKGIQVLRLNAGFSILRDHPS